MILAVIAVLAFLRRPPVESTNVGRPAPAAVVKNLTRFPVTTWKPIGSAGAVPAEKAPGPAKPAFLYVGALGCPYCAAQRWPMIVALSRFGHFSGLTLNRSTGKDVYPNTPTFSFVKAHYQSPYITANLMEIYGRQFSDVRGFYPALMRLTRSEAQAFKKYDGPPYVPAANSLSYPFELVGDRYVWVGSTIDPGMLDGHSWAEISREVRHGQGALGRDILANANALTAAICAVDGNQPGSVCHQVGATPARVVP